MTLPADIEEFSGRHLSRMRDCELLGLRPHGGDVLSSRTVTALAADPGIRRSLGRGAVAPKAFLGKRRTENAAGGRSI
jgi:hypothetical protein